MLNLHLQGATGYLKLGMPLEAHVELESVDAEQLTDCRALAVRVVVYQALAKWELMEAVTKVLCHARPDDAQWPVSLAYATRRAHSLQRALPILLQAEIAFPGEPTTLACYQAQLGHLDAARGRLREAVARAPRYRELALADPDLAPLQDGLRLPD